MPEPASTPLDAHDWIEELPAAVTVTAADGTITAMNRRAVETFADDGGLALIGKSVFDCHPEPSLTRTRELYAARVANHYTIAKNGQKKVIHQLPWYRAGAFAGFVEISIPIPAELPHHDRG
jgi:transcriptional regulator with PAS, ATPase and Fis domain